MDPLSFLQRLGSHAPGSLAHIERIPERRAKTSDVAVSPDLAVRLRKAGIERLWSHQAEALEHLRAGRNVAIATGTASGKSLCYQLATFERLLADPKATALYVFPTKALSQDQLRQLRSFAVTAARAAVFDGDTPATERTWIRKNANVIITNPDMLHFGILPHAEKWALFLKNLQIVVIDEMHTLRGVFGSHVSNVLRRLRRTTGNPLFACASATIGNPADLANRLTGADFQQVTEDGSPRGATYFGLWNPPLINDSENERRSGGTEAAGIFASLIEDGAHTIAFGKSRKQAELLASFARSSLEAAARPDLAARVAAYRAGYLPEERRALERAIADGELLGIAATSALELGIDIGGLDACVLAGYPGTIASTFQQAGRAGRRQTHSLAILVAQDDPLDQFLVNHPDALFGRPHEAAIADHSNPNILDQHVACAAYEKPLSDDDEKFFGHGLKDSVERLVKDGLLKKRGNKLFYAGKGSPHAAVDLRTMGSEVRIVDQSTGALVGTASSSRAPHSVHPGAMYLHQGEQFRVVSLDFEANVALVVPSDEDIYTQARDITDISIIATERKQSLGNTEVFFGVVEVTNQVTSYVRKRLFTGETIDVHPLDMPLGTLRTQAVWYTVPQALLDRADIEPSAVPGAAHAAEHAAIGILPLFAMCDRWDIGGVSTAMHPDTGHCTVFIYDGYPGGAGIAKRAFDSSLLHQRTTRDAIRDCPCEGGCPSCVQSPKCGNGNNPLDKLAAVRLLNSVLEGRVR